MENTAMVFGSLSGLISAQADIIMPETLSVPDILLPQQFYYLLGRRYDLDPGLRLCLAILEDAVFCFMNGIATWEERKKISTKRKRLGREAEEWIFSDMCEKDEPFVYLFVPICESLGIHPEYMRNGLKAWKISQQGGAKLTPYIRLSQVSNSQKIKTSKRKSRPNQQYIPRPERYKAKLAKKATAQRPEMIAGESMEVSIAEAS